MSSFNWWRRNEKRKVLNKSEPLIKRIKNGDFEISQYLKEANNELDTLRVIKNDIQKKGNELDWGKQTIEHDIREQTNQYQRRYNRLVKDFISDDPKILNKLRKELKKEFKDYWDYLYELWLDDKLDDLTVEELYNTYQNIFNNNMEV